MVREPRSVAPALLRRASAPTSEGYSQGRPSRYEGIFAP